MKALESAIRGLHYEMVMNSIVNGGTRRLELQPGTAAQS